uniref:hypothetical protein n=1 Tax=Cephaloticoccus sp. TaxID=1985742 RepID=UPI004048F797
MSQDLSRKHFFAKLTGIFAAFSIVPKLLAKPQPARVSTPATIPSIKLHADTRAVSRRESTV